MKYTREQIEDEAIWQDVKQCGHVADMLRQLLAENDALREDAARLDWVEGRTQINSKGTHCEGLKQDFDAKFVVMPAWYQRGKVFINLREAIDAARKQ